MANKTSFFDLPLEIRQQIYTECFPWDRMITYDPAFRSPNDELSSQQKASSSVWSLWACGGANRKEVQEWMLKTCGVRLVVSPGMDGLPTELPIGQFQKIEILIDHYNRSPDEEQSIDDLRENIVEVVQFLSFSARVDTTSPLNLEVRFRDAGKEAHYASRTSDDDQETTFSGDEYWCEPEGLGDFEEREGCLLAAAADDMSIVEYVLGPLLDLPTCNVYFHELLGLQYVQDEGSEALDYVGMLAMFETYHQWIAGNRQMSFEHLRATYRLKVEMDRWNMKEHLDQI